MFEKVNPSHPDKLADRIAGAVVDLAYAVQGNPKIAVEVMIGHGVCHIIAETSVHIKACKVEDAVNRIVGGSGIVLTNYFETKQDKHLAKNQDGKIRCGDNGIFKGVPVTNEENKLAFLAKTIYEKYPYDGKYIIDDSKIIICQSHMEEPVDIGGYEMITNPLGPWTGGCGVDTGATNRKLGSDMGQSVTGGGLHGKDLSKTDVSVNIYAWLKAQATREPVELCCAIGDETIDGRPYEEIVRIAKTYIDAQGGFEKFAEWGLIRC